MVPNEYRPTDDNLAVLRQGIAVLEQIDDDLYTHVDDAIFRTCVGNHMRHLLDFYGAFLSGLAQRRIDYDVRERSEALARDRGAALARLRQIALRLESLASADVQAELCARQDSSLPDGDGLAFTRSSVERELQALVSHTIHHYALIAVLLRRQGFEPDPAFGVAPSTLAHWQRL
jgi:uncharacterized damage-inducible protein DinB